VQDIRDKQRISRKRDEQISLDGKWRSFPRVPHLQQYVTSGAYFGKVKINGRRIKKSLETAVWSTAQLRLAKFLKEEHENRGKVDPPLFKEAWERFDQELENDATIKPRSKEYRRLCMQKIETTWPELFKLRLDEITPAACKDWIGKLNGKLASTYFNNTVATLRLVIDCGLAMHKGNGGSGFENPAADLKRVRVQPKDLKLPEPSQFKELVANIRKKSGGWAERLGDLVEFLAYGGMRINSEAQWVTWEDVDWTRKEIVVRGDPVTRTKNSEIRRVPILPDMEVLLNRMKAGFAPEQPFGQILQVGECNIALSRACGEIGIARLTHHDLRHLFATRCIESGVDIPTVSRWLGHKDGGALAMKTYGHLRNEHSQAMAQKVKF
jgi:integrase